MTEYEKLLKRKEEIEKAIKEFEENCLCTGNVDFQYEKIDKGLAWYTIRIKPRIMFANGHGNMRARFKCISVQKKETLFNELDYLIDNLTDMRDKLKKKYY